MKKMCKAGEISSIRRPGCGIPCPIVSMKMGIRCAIIRVKSIIFCHKDGKMKNNL